MAVNAYSLNKFRQVAVKRIKCGNCVETGNEGQSVVGEAHWKKAVGERSQTACFQ